MKLRTIKKLVSSWPSMGVNSNKLLRKCDVMHNVEKARQKQEIFGYDPRALILNANGTVIRGAVGLPVKIARVKRAKAGMFHAVGLGEFAAENFAAVKEILKTKGFTGIRMGAISAKL